MVVAFSAPFTGADGVLAGSTDPDINGTDAFDPPPINLIVTNPL